jgi:hypothetical protein
MNSLTSVLESKKLELRKLRNNTEKMDNEIHSLKQGIATTNSK